MSKIISIAASTTDSKSIPHCPQFICFTIGTVPTSFSIENEDGTIFSLDGAGLTNLNGIRLVGQLASNTYVYQIADGEIKKNTTFKIANAHAAVLDVHGWSEGEGSAYVVHRMAKAFANTALPVNDFAYAAFPSAAATDMFNVTFRETKKTANLVRFELEQRLAYKQEVAATRYNIDNYEREFSLIQFTGAADQSVYFTRFVPARPGFKEGL